MRIKQVPIRPKTRRGTTFARFRLSAPRRHSLLLFVGNRRLSRSRPYQWLVLYWLDFLVVRSDLGSDRFFGECLRRVATISSPAGGTATLPLTIARALNWRP